MRGAIGINMGNEYAGKRSNVENMLVFTFCPVTGIDDDKNTAPLIRAPRQGYIQCIEQLEFETPCSTGEGKHAMRHWQPLFSHDAISMAFHGNVSYSAQYTTIDTTIYSTRIWQCKNWNDPVISDIYPSEKKNSCYIRLVKGKLLCVKWATHTQTLCWYCFHFPRSLAFTYKMTVNGFENASFKMWFWCCCTKRDKTKQKKKLSVSRVLCFEWKFAWNYFVDENLSLLGMYQHFMVIARICWRHIQYFLTCY